MEFLHNDKETFSQAINLVTNKNGIRPEIVEKELLRHYDTQTSFRETSIYCF